MPTGLFGLNPWLDGVIRLLIIVGLMTVVAMGLIYIERKVLGRFHARIGPQRTGPFGLLQSVADALKLVGKEDLRPRNADPWTFEFGPYLVFIPIFLGFVVSPFMAGFTVRVLDLGILYFVAVSSVSIVGWVMAGWGSDNRYAMIGGMRAAAQAISYELPFVLSLLSVSMLAGTLNINEIVEAQTSVPNIVWQPLAFIIFFIAALAELNRPPFDIPVGESEVVGGPFVEYSGIRWSMFFLGEYASLFIMSILISALFLGGYEWPFGTQLGIGWQLVLTVIKASMLIFLIIWVRASVPRLRIDQLMGYAWKILLPLSLLQVLVNGFVLVYDLPKLLLTAAGLGGVFLLVWLTEHAITRPRESRATAAATAATLQSEAAS
ncbi:MAG: NADH-quinone oxidoreductase subunit NuoH [Chloroflexi bacterium]|nr:MAG: NADH-quinone oxidoreductase subunit NuoH [Chloroflexota bacterium]